MTQRRWETRDGWDVLTGWDRPLSRFFLVISRGCPLGECSECRATGEHFLFDNLSSPKYPRGNMTLKDVEHELNALLTTWPRAVLHSLANDKAEWGSQFILLVKKAEVRQ